MSDDFIQLPESNGGLSCSICSQLSDTEYALQKYGWEERDTRLPVAANQLETIKELKPGSTRRVILQQCPECGTYYLYQTDYEYLVDGSEDVQQLTRLSFDAAQGYLDQ